MRTGAFGIAFELCIVLLAAACGSDDSEKLRVAKLTEGCSLNSQCEDPLVCAFEHCHRECDADRDCPATARCVRNSDGHVCQFEDDTGCSKNSDCRGAQVCGEDGECRDACSETSDCTKGQICANSGLCASMDSAKDSVDKDGNILRMESPSIGTGGKAGASGSKAGAGGRGGAPGTNENVGDCAEAAAAKPMCEGTKTEEVEPNDSKTDATPICVGQTVSGDSSDATVDSFVLTAPDFAAGGVIVASLSPVASARLRARNFVEARQLAQLPVNDEGTGSVWFTAAPGIKYLLDVENTQVRGGGGYTLTTSWMPILDCFEPNDLAMDAKSIVLDEEIEAFSALLVLDMGNGSAMDWYQIELGDGDVLVRMEDVTAQFPRLTLHDGNGKQLTSTSVQGTALEINAAVTAGRYLISTDWKQGNVGSGTGLPPSPLTTSYKLRVTQSM